MPATSNSINGITVNTSASHRRNYTIQWDKLTNVEPFLDQKYQQIDKHNLPQNNESNSQCITVPNWVMIDDDVTVDQRQKKIKEEENVRQTTNGDIDEVELLTQMQMGVKISHRAGANCRMFFAFLLSRFLHKIVAAMQKLSGSPITQQMISTTRTT